MLDIKKRIRRLKYHMRKIFIVHEFALKALWFLFWWGFAFALATYFLYLLLITLKK